MPDAPARDAPSPQKAAADREEQRRGRQRKALSARAVHEAILREGEDELRRPSSALAWSGLTAGLSMGFSLVAEGLLRANLPEGAWTPLVSKLGYSLGFFIVVLGRQQLFTETTLTAVLPALHPASHGRWRDVARMWAIVLASNLFGALLFAWGTAHTPAFSPEVKSAFHDLGVEAAQWDAWSALLKGIYAGWLIALMVWLLPAAEYSRWVVVVALTYIVGLASLTHIIAGSVEVLYVVADGTIGWTDYIRYMVPTLAGNTIGGVLLVAALNHAQVVAGEV